MGARLDLANKRFGRLVALRDVGSDRNKNRVWLCRCDCGSLVNVRAAELVKPTGTRSCGCIQNEKIGGRYGRLTVLHEVERRNGRRLYRCQCDCGAETIVMGGNLKQGHVKSCGCLVYDNHHNKTHGQKGTRLYRIWSGMKNRCSNSNLREYPQYGGRGITICDEWMAFEEFYSWAKQSGYRDDLTIERVDVNGNYEPANCKWIPLGKQALNRTNTLFVTFKGKKRALKGLCRELRLSYPMVFNRIKYLGWTTEKALSTPNTKEAK